MEKTRIDDSENIQTELNTSDDEVTRKINKKMIIGGICIFAIVLSTITYYSLYKPNNELNSDTSKDEEDLVVKTTQTYEGLNYTQNKTDIVQQGFFYDYSKGKQGSKVNVTYVSVGGLKDKNLEEKINEKLKEEASSMYNSKNLLDNNVLYDNIYNYTDVYIFNNVLSTMYIEELCDVKGKTSYRYKAVNINLKDYKEFDLVDIFTSNANIEEILNTTQHVEDIVFSVSPKFIYYIDDNRVKQVSLYQYRDNIAIYKRFYDGKRMFEKTYKSSPFVYTTKKFFEVDVYGQEDINLFIDTCNGLIDSNFPDEVIESAYMLYKEAVTSAKNVALSNPSRNYLIQLVPYITQSDVNEYILNVDYTSYEIDKSFFANRLKETIIESENIGNEEIIVPEYFRYDSTGLININKNIYSKKVNKIGEDIDK